MNNGRGYEPTLEVRRLMNDSLEDLKKQCLRSHQVVMVKWVLGVLIFTLAAIIITAMADNYFDTSIAYYRQIKMAVLVVVMVAFFVFAGKLLARISSREWVDYLSKEGRAAYNDKMNETCVSCYPPKPHRDLDCIYSDEKCVNLIVEASVDVGIIMVGGQVEVFNPTNDDVPRTPENNLAQMLINRIIDRRFYSNKEVVYINCQDLLANDVVIEDYIADILASKTADHLLFVIDRFYRKGNLDIALKLSRRGHTVIAIAQPSQSPFVYKTLVNALCEVEDYNKKAAMVGFFEETNLIVMRDSATQYRSLDIHSRVTSKLVTKLCDEGIVEVYNCMEDLTTSPQVPPPLRF